MWSSWHLWLPIEREERGLVHVHGKEYVLAADDLNVVPFSRIVRLEIVVVLGNI